jgi:hypothetical protein
VQTTAASQPLLLVHSGANYWFGSGVSGNFVSTPNAAANQIAGDIEFIAKIDYKNNANQCITSKNTGVGSGQLAWTLFINGSNLLNIEIFSTAYTFATSSASIGTTFNGFIKVTRVASTGSVQFFTSSDGITYTQLGTTQSTTAGSLSNVNTPVNIGSYQSTNVFPFLGKIYRATISNAIGGAPVVDFNPNQYNAATSQTQWTSSTGEVWTINTGTAATGYKGVLVDRTEVQTDGIDDNLVNSSTAFTASSIITRYAALNGLTSASSSYLISSLPTDNTMLFWKPTGTTAQMFNGTGINITGYANNSLKMYTSLFNGATSLSLTNNANQNNGSEGTTSIRGIMLGNRNGPLNAPSNALFNTVIYSNSANNSTIRTAMYDYIKSINNSAF